MSDVWFNSYSIKVKFPTFLKRDLSLLLIRHLLTECKEEAGIQMKIKLFKISNAKIFEVMTSEQQNPMS